MASPRKKDIILTMRAWILRGFLAGLVAGSMAAAPEILPAAPDPVLVVVTIKGNTFRSTVERVAPNTPLLFRVTNLDNGMEEFESYDMAFEVIVHPHQTIEIPVAGLGAGTYEYFGDFHPRTARGKITVK